MMYMSVKKPLFMSLLVAEQSVISNTVAGHRQMISTPRWGDDTVGVHTGTSMSGTSVSGTCAGEICVRDLHVLSSCFTPS
jgi:hypothetical protein